MLIGTGFGAQHALWLSQFQGIELCGLAYFSDRDQALAVQSRYGIVELSDDAGSMILSGRYDLIVITSPPSTHLHLMRVAAKASVAVVLEKPVAESVEVAEEIGMIARATGKPAYIFFQWRLHPAVQKLREFVISGEFGVVTHFDADFCHDFLGGNHTLWPWRHTAGSAGAGALADMGVHLFDLLRFISAEEWSIKSADLGVAHPMRSAEGKDIECDADDFANVYLVNAAEARTARVSVSRVAVGTTQLSFRMYGPNGTAALLINVANGNGCLQFEIRGSSKIEETYTGGLNPYDYIIPAIQANQKVGSVVPASIADGIAAQKLMCASVHAGKKISTSLSTEILSCQVQ
ncbi:MULTISPECIES: Gfo/Idh/MocA family protein [unclassified Rhizobium]|uniref:Gfo/Idh/MocA family protein n=1 Tax=unclassified Rhizobium TaxID=2613769 RepID=UPI001ADBEE8A|nr:MULTISPECIES: Gfo/Idh/MocA family oxidoreductase [unclassified Rhizobium]MBO9100947.1 Gfo/Idh/MocA family oxidoreductase [Rhizobium sp. L58/93]MBO9136952.1 Gfo/Idh/MocA family oxidoreductase [Rhizobium sp. B209b/85]MBO9170717.1 Gfo/Idh/MocA family oxidoreductase [Rhizobium sp. L245/93]MBO9188194.1 Gfo/Idh/MocA family oxidoreductase [Rhizobium sp. E27B/91]QXZ86172.1 Gfo/Idh/MocA family oxidoreductase [Rhizobium sp. K1/93]